MNLRGPQGSEPACDQVAERDVDQGTDGPGGGFPIAGEATRPFQPGKGALNDPATIPPETVSGMWSLIVGQRLPFSSCIRPMISASAAGALAVGCQRRRISSLIERSW
jgi:hypothetical protein